MSHGVVHVPHSVLKRLNISSPNIFEFVALSQISDLLRKSEKYTEIREKERRATPSFNDEDVGLDDLGNHKDDGPDRPSGSFKEYFDENLWKVKPWCMFNDMTIERRDGVDYGPGVGSVHVNAVVRFLPTRRRIILE